MKLNYFQARGFLTILAKLSFAIFIICIFSTSKMIYAQELQKPGELSLNPETQISDFATNIQNPKVHEREFTDNFPFPPSWNVPVITGANPHFLIVPVGANPRINDIPLSPGDYIGAFYLNKEKTAYVCGGADVWLGNQNIVFAMFGNDADTALLEKNGFFYSEVIQYRLFSFSKMKDYVVTNISYNTSPGSGYYTGVKWFPLTLSYATNIKATVTFDAYATANPNPICVGGNSQLLANIFIGPGGTYTYNWTSEDGGFTSTLPNPSVSPLITTKYFLTVHSGALISQHNITLIVNQNPIADAGNNGIVCGNLSYQLSGTAQNYSALNWTSSGSGTFNNSTVLNPVYTPSSDDIVSGQVSLTLKVQPCVQCVDTAYDNMGLTILPTPTLFAGSNRQVCSNESILLNAQANNCTTIHWTTSGTGTFTQPNSAITQYLQSAADITAGSVTLTVTGTSGVPCNATISSAIVISFLTGPTAYAPPNRVICENQTVTITGTPTNYSRVRWRTAGDGTFNDSTISTVIYTPGLNDRLNGSVILTYYVFPLTPCTMPATKQTLLTVRKFPVVSAGTTSHVCKNSNLQLYGSSSSCYSVFWNKIGDGFFNNTGILNPIYTPGTNDKANGSFKVILVGSAISPCNVPDFDTLQVTIIDNPTVQIFTANNQQVCQTPEFQLNAQANTYSQVEWTSSGDGTFNNYTSLNPLYSPGDVELAGGQPVKLTVKAIPISPCSVNAESFIFVNFIHNPTANAGLDAAICQNGTHQLSGTAQNQDSVLWTSSGTGTFSNATILNPTYAPSAAEIAAGSATLTLTASAISPCLLAFSDTIILQIQKLPTANAGLDAAICQNGTHQLSGTAQNQNSVLWTSSGTGTFSNATILDPIYTPSTSDITNGAVLLTLKAISVLPCSVVSSDNKLLVIRKNPTANAGADVTICQTATAQLGGTARYQSSVLWTTSGNGTFSNAAILNPVYTPGTTEIASGNVTLTLTALAISPCVTSTFDTKILTIQKSPNANAGADATICQDVTAQLDGIAQNQNSVSWLTLGTGTFSNSTILNPTYAPSAADINAGSVNLIFTVSAVSPCLVSSSDMKILTIRKAPSANAGDDFTICPNATAQLLGNVQNQSSVLWTTSGNGTFSNAAILNPVYTPGTTEIAAGTVTLTLTASAVLPCMTSFSDVMILTFDQPQILNNLVDQEVNAGESLILEFSLQNGISGTYAWYHNGILIDGQNSYQLIISNVSPNDAGNYYAVFSNLCGEVTSSTAFVKIFVNTNMKIMLNAGWSGISTFLQPNNPAMATLFEPVITNIEIIESQTGIFWPQENTNTIGNWSFQQGYKIKMINSDSLIITGKIQYPKLPVIIPQGWSYLPINSVCVVNVYELFNSMPEITIIKEIAGLGVYWPEHGINSIEQLIPGQAYEILNSGNSDIEIVFPECDNLK